MYADKYPGSCVYCSTGVQKQDYHALSTPFSSHMQRRYRVLNTCIHTPFTGNCTKIQYNYNNRPSNNNNSNNNKENLQNDKDT